MVEVKGSTPPGSRRKLHLRTALADAQEQMITSIESRRHLFGGGNQRVVDRARNTALVLRDLLLIGSNADPMISTTKFDHLSDIADMYGDMMTPPKPLE